MIVEIESVYGDCYLFGKETSRSEILRQMKNVLNYADEKDFTDLFCGMYGYDKLTVKDSAEVDFRIDLDTHEVYVPKL